MVADKIRPSDDWINRHLDEELAQRIVAALVVNNLIELGVDRLERFDQAVAVVGRQLKVTSAGEVV